ncbi:hypothetical protein BDY21DRAFT_371515 [Lineolata rhizophorae]|uniref:Uncharacterized protein n=1 Tax=Lineolata rhizophorae TaxID=578093 RepID=A0A6A6P1X5_9PEZI|nr:hypothetical protein BDY21DRAFT_371515 [Lineolata rhizophorae]
MPTRPYTPPQLWPPYVRERLRHERILIPWPEIPPRHWIEVKLEAIGIPLPRTLYGQEAAAQDAVSWWTATLRRGRPIRIPTSFSEQASHVMILYMSRSDDRYVPELKVYRVWLEAFKSCMRDGKHAPNPETWILTETDGVFELVGSLCGWQNWQYVVNSP